MKKELRLFNLADLLFFSYFLFVVRKCIGMGIYFEVGLMSCVCYLGWLEVFEGFEIFEFFESCYFKFAIFVKLLSYGFDLIFIKF